MGNLFKKIDNEIGKNNSLSFHNFKNKETDKLVKNYKEELDKTNTYLYSLNRYRNYIISFLNLMGDNVRRNSKKDLIVKILKEAQGELHAREIFKQLESIGCENLDSNHNKLASYLHILWKKDVISNGSKKGYWKAK